MERHGRGDHDRGVVGRSKWSEIKRVTHAEHGLTVGVIEDRLLVLVEYSLARGSLFRVSLMHPPTEVARRSKSLLIFRNRVKPWNQKYSASVAGQISGINWPSHPTRGADRDRHERAVGCGGREGVDNERRPCVRQKRVVLTPASGVKFQGGSRFPGATVATEIGSPGRARDKS